MLMNEIFATTSEREGEDIAAEVLHAFSHTHSHMIFVTHLKCLADMVEDEKPEREEKPGADSDREARLELADGERAVNYVTEQFEETDGKTRKTHRIVKGHPEAGIFEKELFDKYFGTVLRGS